ncbi:hypothetical protein Tco_0060253 [Tanacetum coccineum]
MGKTRTRETGKAQEKPKDSKTKANVNFSQFSVIQKATIKYNKKKTLNVSNAISKHLQQNRQVDAMSTSATYSLGLHGTQRLCTRDSSGFCINSSHKRSAQYVSIKVAKLDNPTVSTPNDVDWELSLLLMHLWNGSVPASNKGDVLAKRHSQFMIIHYIKIMRSGKVIQNVVNSKKRVTKGMVIGVYSRSSSNHSDVSHLAMMIAIEILGSACQTGEIYIHLGLTIRVRFKQSRSPHQIPAYELEYTLDPTLVLAVETLNLVGVGLVLLILITGSNMFVLGSINRTSFKQHKPPVNLLRSPLMHMQHRGIFDSGCLAHVRHKKNDSSAGGLFYFNVNHAGSNNTMLLIKVDSLPTTIFYTFFQLLPGTLLKLSLPGDDNEEDGSLSSDAD